MDRAALVTGGSSGIGLAIARMLRHADGVRAVAICPGFVATPMAEWSGLKEDEMIQPEDCAEVVRMLLRLSSRARVPQVVIERAGSTNGDVPVTGA
jgi:NAD(P)-dependent dehydrogenase (short-subunit alcohol dehydrogenase family)